MPAGERLAAERRRQGRSLAEVEAATNIRLRLLELLEEGRYAQMPSTAYVRGYIKNYAQFLGVDPTELLTEFDADLGARRIPTAHLDRVPARTVVVRHDQMHHIGPRAWITLAAILIAVGLGVWAVGALLGGESTPPPIPPAGESPSDDVTATPPGETTGSAPATGSIDPGGTTNTSGEPFTLVVTVAENSASWLRVTVDGLVAYEGTLTGGASKTWTVTRSATVRAGRPSAVSITRDGRSVTLIEGGGVGQVTMSAATD